MKIKGRGVLVAVILSGAFMAPPLVGAAGVQYEGLIVGDPNGTVSFDGSPKKGSKVKNIFVGNIDATCSGQPAELGITYTANATVKRRGKFELGNQVDFFKGRITKNGTASGTVRFKGRVRFGQGDTRICDTGVENWEASVSLE